MEKVSAYPSFNSKYKTIECHDWKTSAQGCNRGSKCHFAHGLHELRKPDDPLPIDYSAQVKDARSNFRENPYCNYKTIKCKNLLETGSCKFGHNCKYAHGERELRNPYDPISQTA